MTDHWRITNPTYEWRDLPTMQDVAAAQAAGDEIHVKVDGPKGAWFLWDGSCWLGDQKYRARPHKPATKTVTLRRALLVKSDGTYGTLEGDEDFSKANNFVMWLPGEETVEVPA